MLFPYKDDNPRILVPYVTYGIIAINVLVFILQFNLSISNPIAEESFIYSFGFYSCKFFVHNNFHIDVSSWWIFAHNGQHVVSLGIW